MGRIQSSLWYSHRLRNKQYSVYSNKINVNELREELITYADNKQGLCSKLTYDVHTPTSAWSLRMAFIFKRESETVVLAPGNHEAMVRSGRGSRSIRLK